MPEDPARWQTRNFVPPDPTPVIDITPQKPDDTCATCTRVERCAIYRYVRDTQLRWLDSSDFGCKWHWPVP